MIDENGPTTFSMRALAERLGVTAAAIYYHFENKQQLLEAAATHATTKIVAVAADVDTPWRLRIQELAVTAVAEAQRTPQAFLWLLSTYSKQAPLEVINNALLSSLRDGGVDGTTAQAAKGAILRLILGHLSISGMADVDEPAALADHILRRGIAGIIEEFAGPER